MKFALANPKFQFDSKQEVYNGKVRDVYTINDKLVMVASDRISAFDHILPRAIPYKGQVLNLIAQHFLEASKDIVPNWLERVPHPNVSIGKKCTPIRIEMVVRGYLAGHAWRLYKAGDRTICGVEMQEGMVESQQFTSPIITPATKAESGHDEDISAEEILKRGIVTADMWNTLCDYSLKLFELGTQMARERGLILVDTKYEFGLYNGNIVLIDEVHTPDSSRYYILDEYESRLAKGEKQDHLSKEFVREWLMENGFQGKDGQVMPEMPDDFVDLVSDRYINLYERLTNKKFIKKDLSSLEEEILTAVKSSL